MAAAIGLLFILVVLRLGRTQRLSFRYTIGWSLLGLLGVLGGLSLKLLNPLADILQVSPAAIVATSGIVILLALCVQLSISISGLQEQIRTLAEEIAFTKVEITELGKETT